MSIDREILDVIKGWDDEAEERKNLILHIARFIDESVKPVDTGYAPVTTNDLGQLRYIFGQIVEKHWDPDVDGDYPINFRLIDRTEEYLPYFNNIPYPHEDKRGWAEAVVFNSYVAGAEMETLYKFMSHGWLWESGEEE